MRQRPDHKSGAYYVTIRHGAQTIYALGPFRRHQRALGLVDAVRLLISRAGLDPWCEFGYGTARARHGAGAVPCGQYNRLLDVGPDYRGPMRAAQPIPTAILARLESNR